MFAYTLPDDPGKWYSGLIKIDVVLTTDAAMSTGKYDVCISLPDKYESLAKSAEYTIRLANENTWEETTGYNKLSMAIKQKRADKYIWNKLNDKY